jgi:hypothetical protein
MAFFVPSLRARLIPLSILAGWVGFSTSRRFVITTRDGVSGILGLEQVGADFMLTGGSGVSFAAGCTEGLVGFGGVAEVSVGGAGNFLAIDLGGGGGGVCIASA